MAKKQRMTKEEMRQAAIHEAGHVVAHMALGGQMKKAGARILTIEGHDGSSGWAHLGKQPSAQYRVQAGMAGALAVRRAMVLAERAINDKTFLGLSLSDVAGIAQDLLELVERSEFVTNAFWGLAERVGDWRTRAHAASQLVMRGRAVGAVKPEKHIEFGRLCGDLFCNVVENIITSRPTVSEELKSINEPLIPTILLSGDKSDPSAVAWLTKLFEQRQRAAQLVERRWTNIERIADALLQKKIITGPELDKIFKEESNTTLPAA